MTIVLFSFPGSCYYSLECSHRSEQIPKKGIFNTVDIINDTRIDGGTFIFSTYAHTYIECMPKTLLVTITWYPGILRLLITHYNYLVSRYQFQVRNERQRREKNEWKAAGVRVKWYYQGRGHAAGGADAEPSPLAHCGPPPSLSWRSPLYYTYQHTSTLPLVQAV